MGRWWWGDFSLPLKEILKTATYTVNYAPMLAILFLACRMRVTWLSQRRGGLAGRLASHPAIGQ